jgi:hypothetical protein
MRYGLNEPPAALKRASMMKKQTGRQSERDIVSEIDDLMERLSTSFSENEIVNIFGNSLLALDDAGFEKIAVGLGRKTAAALKKVIEPGASKQSNESNQRVDKILQEWKSGWREWDACISETANEGDLSVLMKTLDKEKAAND